MVFFSINISLIILIILVSYSKGKNLTILNMINKDNVNSVNSQIPRNLENDNYILLYFNQDCSYSSGFVNEYRNEIDFIINENNKNIK